MTVRLATRSRASSPGDAVAHFLSGTTIGLISLAAYMIGYADGGQPLGQTMAFAVLGFSQLFHVRNLHSNRRSSFRTGLLANKPCSWLSWPPRC